MLNEKNKLVGINKFVDIIAKYSNIGKKQQQTLKDATKEAFIQHKDGKHPSLKEIYDLVIESVGDNRDTLTEIMERLSEYELFASRVNDPSIFLNNNYYFSLSVSSIVLSDSRQFFSSLTTSSMYSRIWVVQK
mgnify:FL=1